VAERVRSSEYAAHAKRQLSRHLEVHAKIEVDAEVGVAVAIASALRPVIERDPRVHVRRDRKTLVEREAVADRNAERNAKQVAAAADGDIQSGGQQKIERQLGARTIEPISVLGSEQELAVAVAIRIREAAIERELRLG